VFCCRVFVFMWRGVVCVTICALYGTVAIHVSLNASEIMAASPSGYSFGLEVETGLNLACKKKGGNKKCFVPDHDDVFKTTYWKVQFENGYSNPDAYSTHGNFEWITEPSKDKPYLDKDQILSAIIELNAHLAAFNDCKYKSSLVSCMNSKGVTPFGTWAKKENEMELEFMDTSVKFLFQVRGEKSVNKISAGLVLKPQVTVGILMSRLQEEFENADQWLTKDVVRVQRGAAVNANLVAPFAQFRRRMLKDAAAHIDASPSVLKKIKSSYNGEGNEENDFELNLKNTIAKLPISLPETTSGNPIVSKLGIIKEDVSYPYKYEDSDDEEEVKEYRADQNKAVAQMEYCSKWLGGFLTYLRHMIQYMAISNSGNSKYEYKLEAGEWVRESPAPWGGCGKDLMGILPKTSPACVMREAVETGCKWTVNPQHFKEWYSKYFSTVGGSSRIKAGIPHKLQSILDKFADTQGSGCVRDQKPQTEYMAAFGDGGASVLSCPVVGDSDSIYFEPKKPMATRHFSDTVVPHEIRAVSTTGAVTLLEYFSGLADLPAIVIR